MLSAAANVVLIPLPTGDYLGLTPEQFAEARLLGQQLAGAVPQVGNQAPEEPLLTAEQMQERTGVPVPWFLEQARQNAIPHSRLGKYVRFKYSDVAEAVCVRQKGHSV